MDKLAAAQLDVDRRDSEIEQLNEELDGKVRAHEDEIQQVEAEWRDELVQARAQVDELKDVSFRVLLADAPADEQALEQRELDTKDLRDALLEREDELLQANDRVAELQGAQAETHDRLEETLKNIERDNAEKDADLIEANREVDAVRHWTCTKTELTVAWTTHIRTRGSV
jgi:chromosome segregation ATPase